MLILQSSSLVPLSQPSQRVMYVSPPYLSLGIFYLCTPTQADGRDGGYMEPKKTTARQAWASSNIFPPLLYTVNTCVTFEKMTVTK